jgi:putative spermidine/putrescine transport system permease protein
MSSSSAPEPPQAATPHLEVGELEQVEELLERRRPRAERALGERAAGAGGRAGLVTALWATPGAAWLLFYLVAPVFFIILVSFWTKTIDGFTEIWTLENYRSLFGDETYWRNMWTSFRNSLIVVAACLVFGFPIAYFLALKVQSLRNQVALFIIALAPFWTSYLIRAVAWNYPLMGRQGAVNSFLQKIGVVDAPLDVLSFSNFAVILAMIQLYILFMITPLFFMLAQIDQASLEAARDLGGNWVKTFREVILPQSMPGIVIGSIFVFVLTMGDYGTYRVVGGGTKASIGVIIRNQVDFGLQYPSAAASAVILVVAMMLGVFVLLRFSNLREEL